MTAQKCVVEGCDLEYDVVCSFSFYNVNTSSEDEGKRQEWIEGAMHDDSECLWRHVSLQLCGYHFELDSQGLWIDSPMLPELLAAHEMPAPRAPTASDKAGGSTAGAGCPAKAGSGYQGLFEKFLVNAPTAAHVVRIDHNYSAERAPTPPPPAVSRLNVRQLVDTLGYLSLKNLQRKQLWVVKVETDKAEASIAQSEQVITKMLQPKQVIEIIPQTSTAGGSELHLEHDGSIPDNFIYEIAEEQEITMDEVKEIPAAARKEWMVNIVPEESKPKYAYIKHCNTGKKKRHFTSELNEITLHGDFENYYILPDVDPSSSVEVTTTYEPENYIVEEYQHLVLEERPKKKPKVSDPTKKKKKKLTPMRNEIKAIQIQNEQLGEDWVLQNELVYEQEAEEFDDKNKSRVRRRNKKYYDFVT